jgi:hypothetical protein
VRIPCVYPSRGPAGTPMTQAELWAKFADCAGRSLPPARLPAVFEKLLGIADVAAVGDLTALLAPDAQRQDPARAA